MGYRNFYLFIYNLTARSLPELPRLILNCPSTDHEVVGVVLVAGEAPPVVCGHIQPTVAAYSCKS